MPKKLPTNPYPGLRPFEFGENHLFFGREGQSEELLKRLKKSHFVAVVGTSGSGKSSLVRAGLLPLLYGGIMTNAGSNWRVALFRPGDDPIHNLASALDGNNQPIFTKTASPKTDRDKDLNLPITETILRRSAVGLRDYANSIEFAEGENLLVVVDQFEELFRFKKESQTIAPADKSIEQVKAENEASALVKLLLEATKMGGPKDETSEEPPSEATKIEASRDETSEEPTSGGKAGRVYVVITMRSDFLGDCSQFRDLPEAINHGQYLIPRLTTDQLRKAVEAPARVKGARLEPELVARLLNDIGDDQDQLPVLQHALMRTWDKWATTDNRKSEISFADYNATGGMATALSIHANEAFAELADPNSKELSRKQQIAEKLFKCLTETDRENREIRRATSLGKICAIADADIAEVIPVIDTFRKPGRTFLMPPMAEELDETTLIDISHESLIRKWDLLRKWVDEEAQAAQTYRRLAEDALLHERKKVPYWSDPQLADALEWRDKFKPNEIWAELYSKSWGNRYLATYPVAIKYLEASELSREEKLAEEERKRNREIEQERRLRHTETEKASVLEQSARKLRRYLYMMIALSFLFLAAAGFAVAMAYRAKSSAAAAKKSEDNALFYLRQTLDNQDVISAQKKSVEDANQLLSQSLVVQKTEREKAERERVRADEQTVQARKSEALKANALKAADKERRNALGTVDRERLSRKALTLLEQGENNQAVEIFRKLTGLYDAQVTIPDAADRQDGMWWTQHNLGIAHSRLGEYAEAETAYQNALGAIEKSVKPTGIQASLLNHAFRPRWSDGSDQRTDDLKRSRATTLRRLAQLHRQWAENALTETDSDRLNTLAIDEYRQLLALLQVESPGMKSRSYPADVSVELADAYTDLGSAEAYSDADEFYSAAQTAYETDRNFAKEVAVFKKWADLYMVQRQGIGAAEKLLAALDLQENKLDLSPVSLEVAQTYSDIAEAYQLPTRVLHPSSKPYEDVSTNIRILFSAEKKGALNADQVRGLAGAYRRAGKCSQAKAVFEIELGELRREKGPEYFDLLVKAGTFYWREAHEDQEALSYFALYEVESENRGPDGDNDQMTARYFIEHGDAENALKLLRRDLIIQNGKLVVNSTGQPLEKLAARKIDILLEVAKFYEGEENLPQAEAIYHEALALAGSGPVKNTISVMQVLAFQADFFVKQRRLSEAQANLNQVESVWKEDETELERHDWSVEFEERDLRLARKLGDLNRNDPAEAQRYYGLAKLGFELIVLPEFRARNTGVQALYTRYLNGEDLTFEYYLDLADFYATWADLLGPGNAYAVELRVIAQENRDIGNKMKAATTSHCGETPN